MNAGGEHKCLAHSKTGIRRNICNDKGINKMHGFTKQDWGESHTERHKTGFVLYFQCL